MSELRRSTRARKQVKSYAEEQAEEHIAVVKPTKAKPARKKRSKAHIDESEEVALPSATEPEDDEEFEADEEPPPKKRAKKSMKSKDAAKDGGQLYGHPAFGTMVQSGDKMRKQPIIYAVPQKTGPRKTDWMNDAGNTRVAQQLAAIPRLAPGEEETRLRAYEEELPDWYEPALEKAGSQKMCVLERERGVEEDCHAGHDDCPCETLKIAGSKGNVYDVRISHLTTCNCPVTIWNRKGSETQCKHVLYVLHYVLRAPEHLKYQAAFLTSELKELFANAPPLPIEVAEEDVKDGNRKEVSGDCPICFMDFEEGEAVVWCKAACGNNIHKQCFKKWADMKRPVTCPFCRSQWQDEDEPKSKGQKTKLTKVDQSRGGRDAGGYVNVADQLRAGDDSDDE